MKKTNKVTSNPTIINFQGFDGKTKKLRPLETATHLQSIVNYTLPNGTQAGALLLNLSNSVEKPDYRLILGIFTKKISAF